MKNTTKIVSNYQGIYDVFIAINREDYSILVKANNKKEAYKLGWEALLDYLKNHSKFAVEDVQEITPEYLKEEGEYNDLKVFVGELDKIQTGKVKSIVRDLGS